MFEIFVTEQKLNIRTREQTIKHLHESNPGEREISYPVLQIFPPHLLFGTNKNKKYNRRKESCNPLKKSKKKKMTDGRELKLDVINPQ